MPLRPLYCLALLVVIWAGVYLPALGTRELQGEEARRVLPGRTMLQTGEWIVPRSGGRVYNRKPPLVNWISAGAIHLTGRMDEWTVRLPSTLMMLAMAITMYGVLRGWLGNDGAFLAAVISLTNIGFAEKGRLIEIEALYISLFGMALAVWLGLRWRHRVTSAWIAAGLILGLGFLAKGPVHLVYFYALVVAILYQEGKLRELWNWRHLMGLACFFAVWTPWAMINAARNPLKDSGKVWVNQITHRLGFSEFDFVNYLLQIPQSFVNFLPWALLLPLCWRFAPAGTDRSTVWLRGLRKGLLWGFLLVALLPSSRPRFMLPLNVAAAILVAEMLLRVALPRFGYGWLVACATLSACGSLIAGVGLWRASAVGWLWLPVLILGLWLSWRLIGVARRAPIKAAHWGLAVGLAMTQLAAAFSLTIAPRLLATEDLRPFAAQITSRVGAEEPIILYKLDEHMWPFYLGMRCLEISDIKTRPRTYPVNWLMMYRDTWDKERALLLKLFGDMKTETPLIDPRDKREVVLLHFGKS